MHTVSARRLARVAALVTALSLVTASVAMADDMVADGDGGVVNTFPLQFGNVCVGQTYTGSITVYIQRAWPASNPADQSRTFNGGSTVTISISSQPANTALTASMPAGQNTIILPATWRTDPVTYPNLYIYTGDTATMSLSLTPTALGPSGTVTVPTLATGTGGNTGTTAVSRNLQAPRATWTGINCNTAPGAPGKPAATPASPNLGGFTLNWTPSTDDGKPNPPAAVTYELQGQDADDLAFGSVASGIATNSHTFVAGTPAEGTWTYRVRASDSVLTSGWSASSDPVVVDRTDPTFGTCPAGGPYLLNSGGGSESVGPISASDPTLPDGSVGSGMDAGASTLSGTVDTTSVGSKTVTFTATDNAGNSDTQDCTYDVTNTAPTAPGKPAPTPASPNQGDFALNWTASTDDGSPTPPALSYELQGQDADDAGFGGVASGITTNSYDFASGAPAEGTWTYRVRASDSVLTSSWSASSDPVVVDRTDPTFGTCPAGGPYLLNSGGGSQSVGPISASDPTLPDGSAGSGVNAGASTLSGTVDTTSVGSKTVTFTATDNAGNSDTTQCSYSVNYAFTGFFRPIENPDTINVVKAGQAIPIKFSLGGNQGLNIFAAGSPGSVRIVCDAGSSLDSIEQTVTAGGSSLSYDATTDTYNYVWKTNKAWANTCRELTVTLADGTEHTALFKFSR